jgi:hypothetical protein
MAIKANPLLPRRLGNALVQRHHLKGCGTAVRGNQRRGEPQPIGRRSLCTRRNRTGSI